MRFVTVLYLFGFHSCQQMSYLVYIIKTNVDIISSAQDTFLEFKRFHLCFSVISIYMDEGILIFFSYKLRETIHLK